MQYELENLGSDNFERLTQALLLRHLGPEARVYGQGKDGGRELAYRGQAKPDPTGATSVTWSGYILMQAKFRADRLGTERDQDWFIKTAEAEMKVWANPKSERRLKGEIPDYIVFTTNVRLSPASGGGLDRFDAMMRDMQVAVPIKGGLVLHREQVERMLDDSLAIRRRYAAFIAPADALSSADEISNIATDFKSTLIKHATKLVSSERIIRLSEQGLKTGDKLYLEEVGVDLKATRSASRGSASVDTLKYVLKHGEQVLASGTGATVTPHIVIVGGPGQGKTTLSQMLTQVYRAALLRDQDASSMPPRVSSVLEATRQTMLELRLPEPANRRWPIRIDLAAYGDAIAGGEDLTLLRWITKQVAMRAETTVSGSTMLTWLQSWSWLVVLDGLDEVAHPDVRESVRSQIDDFLVEAADCGSDLLVVVTTRPQGYDESFGQPDFTRLRLSPFNRDDAVNYAKRVAAVRNHDDEGLRVASVERLRAAFDQPATAKLMSTPLQVTIMLLLFEIAATVPTSRFDLFSDYFDTIYSRETAKKGHLAEVLKARRADVAHLHQQVGIRLQLESERTGNAEAVLDREQLRQLTLERLRSEGVNEGEAAKLTERLVTAALGRLVLLVPRGDGVGFDVRSLQEFMAASALTTGPDASILERLSVIAPSAHWRNTLLLSLGRVFSNREHLRRPAISLLREVDALTPGASLATLGPELALASLEDGFADGAPLFRRLLLIQALEMLRQPPRVGPMDDVASILCQMSGDEESIEHLSNAFRGGMEASASQRATTIIVMRAIDGLQRHGNPLWRFVRDFLPLSTRTVEDTELAVIDAWVAGGGVMPSTGDFKVTTEDRRAAIGRLLTSIVKKYPDGDQTVAQLSAMTEELNSSTVVLLEPTFAFAWPPDQAPKATELAAALDDPVKVAALITATSSLPSGWWTITAHLNALARDARAREPVGQHLALDRPAG